MLHNYGTVRQHDISVGVSYDTDLNKALTVIRGVLEGNDKVLKDPAPIVAVVGFGDSSINISIKPWSELKNFAAVRAEAHMALADAFRAHQIEIPFPQREIRILGSAPGPGPG